MTAFGMKMDEHFLVIDNEGARKNRTVRAVRW